MQLCLLEQFRQVLRQFLLLELRRRIFDERKIELEGTLDRLMERLRRCKGEGGGTHDVDTDSRESLVFGEYKFEPSKSRL